LVLHEPFERPDPCVLDGIKLIPEPKRHLDARIWRGLVVDFGHTHVVTRLTLAL
jgi:hypothetical protein